MADDPIKRNMDDATDVNADEVVGRAGEGEGADEEFEDVDDTDEADEVEDVDEE